MLKDSHTHSLYFFLSDSCSASSASLWSMCYYFYALFNSSITFVACWCYFFLVFLSFAFKMCVCTFGPFCTDNCAYVHQYTPNYYTVAIKSMGYSHSHNNNNVNGTGMKFLNVLFVCYCCCCCCFFRSVLSISFSLFGYSIIAWLFIFITLRSHMYYVQMEYFLI